MHNFLLKNIDLNQLYCVMLGRCFLSSFFTTLKIKSLLICYQYLNQLEKGFDFPLIGLSFSHDHYMTRTHVWKELHINMSISRFLSFFKYGEDGLTFQIWRAASESNEVMSVDRLLFVRKLLTSIISFLTKSLHSEAIFAIPLAASSVI